MMKYPNLPLLTALFGLCAMSCQPPNSATTQQNVVTKRENEAATATLPRVITPGWHVLGDGKPSLDVTGYSCVSYVRDAAPKDVVEVFYHGQDNPRINTNTQEYVSIMGQKIQTYSSGNEDPAFATQPILLTSPNGKSAYYSFQFNNMHLYKTRQIPQFGW